MSPITTRRTPIGFINLWGLPTTVQALREQGKLSNKFSEGRRPVLRGGRRDYHGLDLRLQTSRP